MFVSRTESSPLYVGQAYGESVRSRVTSHRSFTDKVGRWAFDHRISIEELEFKVAYFMSDDKRLYDYVENLLVYDSKPIINKEYKDAYRGPKLKIHNRGENGPLEPDRSIDTALFEEVLSLDPA